MLGHEFLKLKKKLRVVVVCDFLDRSVSSGIFPGMKFNDRSGSMLSVLKKGYVPVVGVLCSKASLISSRGSETFRV